MRNERITMSEFFDAIKKGDIDKVQQMIQSDAKLVDSKSDNGLTAVITATYYNEPRIAEVLVSKGAKLNIHDASAVGKSETVKKILAEDPNLLNSYSSDGFTPLHLASFFGHQEIAKSLLEKGANVNAVAMNPLKVMPLHSAVAHRHLEIVKLLVEHGANVNAGQESGYTPLHEAAQNGNLEIARLLLSHGAAVNPRNDEGKTPLALTKVEGREAGSKEDRERVGNFLLEHGATE